jgi:peptidoglycan-associated lipoprotein
VIVAVAGCARRAPRPTTGDGGAGSGVIEEGIGAGGESSLDLARQGRAPGEDGVLRDVSFAYDSEELDDAARTVLDENVVWMNDHAAAPLELEGHCDNRGTVEYNVALGYRRARVVYDYLVGQGVAPERLKTMSYGKELPLCREETEECWARNRRVHFAAGRR